MESNNVLWITKLLILFIIVDIFVNLMALTNPLLAGTCGILNIKACYPAPISGTPQLTGLNVNTTRSVLLAPVWITSYIVDTFSLFGSVIFGAYSLNLGVVNIAVDGALGVILFFLILFSLPLIIEFAKSASTIVQGFFQLIGGLIVGSGAASATALGYGMLAFWGSVVVIVGLGFLL